MITGYKNTFHSIVSDDIIDRIAPGMPDDRRQELLAKVEDLLYSDADRLHNMMVLHMQSPILCHGFLRAMLEDWLEIMPRPIEELTFPEELFESVILLSEEVRKMGTMTEYEDEGISLLGGVVFDAVRSSLECLGGMKAGLSMSLAVLEEMVSVLGREIAMLVMHAAQDFIKMWLDDRMEIGLNAMSALSTVRGFTSNREADKHPSESPTSLPPA